MYSYNKQRLYECYSVWILTSNHYEMIFNVHVNAYHKSECEKCIYSATYLSFFELSRTAPDSSNICLQKY